jgi:hypothetical protein
MWYFPLKGWKFPVGSPGRARGGMVSISVCDGVLFPLPQGGQTDAVSYVVRKMAEVIVGNAWFD